MKNKKLDYDQSWLNKYLAKYTQLIEMNFQYTRLYCSITKYITYKKSLHLKHACCIHSKTRNALQFFQHYK